MKSELDKQFHKCFRRLPKPVQKQARTAYQLFKVDPYHRSLYFKCINDKKSIYSARVGMHYRVVGVLEGETITWFWIGSHEEYNHLF